MKIFLNLWWMAVVVNASDLQVPKSALYGMHFPQGEAVKDYAISTRGMWKNATLLQYKFQYYPQYATPNHPFNKDQLINNANGNAFYTCRDANGHVLGSNDPESLSAIPNTWAFHEHNGLHKDGSSTQAFTQFWFDDNWLARYFCLAYNLQEPGGLYEPGDFIRWRILGGDTNWTPYKSTFPDTLALNGIYHAFLAKNDKAFYQYNYQNALQTLSTIINTWPPKYESETQRWEFDFQDNYHFGLVRILVDMLATLEGAATTISSPNGSLSLVDLSISMRSQILSNISPAGPGWTSGFSSNDVINIESISVNLLALGVGAKWVFEPYYFQVSTGYFVRPHHVVSAVQGLSPIGSVIQGTVVFPAGSYTAQFYLRLKLAQGLFANIVVKTSSVIVTPMNTNLAKAGDWYQVNVPFKTDGSPVTLKVEWTGIGNLDVGPIRIR